MFLLAKHYSGHTLRRYWVGDTGGTDAWGGSVGEAWSSGCRDSGEMGRFERLEGISKSIVEELRRGGGCVDPERACYRDLQREIGFDPYWRVYFSLTRGL